VKTLSKIQEEKMFEFSLCLLLFQAILEFVYSNQEEQSTKLCCSWWWL